MEKKIAKAVAKEIKKFETAPIKRTKVVKKDAGLSMEDLYKMPWSEVHKRAKGLGA